MSKEFKGTKGFWNLTSSDTFYHEIMSDELNLIGYVAKLDIEIESNANVKLIVKAPEMLEALQFFVNNNMLSVIGEEVAERLINEILE